MKHQTAILMSALMMCSCADRITNPRGQTTAALTQRKSELETAERTDDYGCMWGPTRWISHATDQKKSREELQAINSELSRRNQ